MSAASDALGTALGLAAWGVLLTLAATDLRERRLPLPLTRALIGLGLASAAVNGGWAALGWAGCAALLAALPFLALQHLLPSRPAWTLGGGDVRLAAGLGAWLGLSSAWSALALGCALAVVAGLLLRGPGRAALPFGTCCALGVMLLHLLPH
ncbi:prepilin peptidase [Roseomonas chloroacetimidivorans]|uniref:prepilin peptidase n=1 Tax=Roseomonas chloroacetimidivorans TaxID=1766656 RepID=UPI003C723EBA